MSAQTMRIIQTLIANNYRIRHIRLEDLRDLNIIIGPNNCGKSSILEIIELLNNLSASDHRYKCPQCESAKRLPTQHGLATSFNVQAKRLRKEKIDVTFTLFKEKVESLFAKDILDQLLKAFLAYPDHVQAGFTLVEGKAQQLLSDHIFPYPLKEVKGQLLKVLRCPEERLQTYKGTDITSYIRDQKIRANIMQEWLSITRRICDPRIETYNTTSLDFVRKTEEEFDTPITEQGSGVRSLICLLADILSQSQANIVLIDEPELGLNPAGKQALLRFLLRQTTDKQIFVATHDPTFVNPVLWQRDRVSLYLFSPVADTFMKLDLDQSKQDSDTFAGFLPHTTSLKKIHLYVEGSTDVYIFQIFLRKFLIETYPENWFAKLNKVGIFHLAGDFWNHLLYTIPQTPYHSVVILDGDKKADVEGVVKKLNAITRLPDQPDRFKLCRKRTQLKHRGRPIEQAETKPILVYCLEKNDIEDYIDPKPKDKEEGPLNAEKMHNVPVELEDIFRSLPLKAK
jgi:energy-coupling factor transporter ATP-binding protein EcfA2